MQKYNLKNILWLLLSAAIIIIDQTSKTYISVKFYLHQWIRITPFFNIVHAQNRGAAFSFLATAGGWQQWLFGASAVIISIIIIYWLLTLPPKRKWLATALCFILGGAIGNVIDRILHGYVIDFLDFHYKTYHWPAFNVADAMVVTGTIMLILSLFRLSTNKAAQS